MRKVGQQLRITAQLIDVEANTHLWSKTYERELKDVFAIQDEIAKAVTGALSVTLDVGAMARARGGTTNLDAYDQYLRAKALDRQHSGNKATPYYREAVMLDPSFLSAWSGLYYDLAGTVMYASSAADVRREMDQVGARVLSLAPQSWQAQSILAGQLVDQHRWLEAEAALDKARAAGADFGLDASAGGAVTHGGVDTLFLWNTGRIEEAVPIAQRRHEADPLSLQASDVWQTMLLLAHRGPDVEVEYQRSKALEGNHGSIDSMEDARKMMGDKSDPSFGRDRMQPMLQSLSRRLLQGKIPPGRIDDRNALAIMRTALADPSATSGLTIYIAMYAGYLGDKDLLLAAFRRSYVDLHGPDIFYLWFPFWTSFAAIRSSSAWCATWDWSSTGARAASGATSAGPTAPTISSATEHSFAPLAGSGTRRSVFPQFRRQKGAIVSSSSLNTRGVPATMLPFCLYSPPSSVATSPPASRISSVPAAVSQGFRPISQKPSVRPAAHIGQIERRGARPAQS